MSTTGATPEQIEAAAERLHVRDGPFRRTQYAQQRGQVRRIAAVLVPPGSLIIEPEQITALRRVVGDVRVIPDRSFFGYETTDDDLALLDALIGEPT